jgi:hypothetical protein
MKSICPLTRVFSLDGVCVFQGPVFQQAGQLLSVTKRGLSSMKRSAAKSSTSKTNEGDAAVATRCLGAPRQAQKLPDNILAFRDNLTESQCDMVRAAS